MTLEELAFGISQLTGELRFEGDRVALQASGAVGGDGKIRASGGMTLGPAFFGPAEVTLEAERVPIAYPEGFRGRATGTLLLSGDPENAYIVSGNVALAQGYYTAEFDASTQSIGRLDWQLAALRGGTIGEMLPLDIDIRLAGPLRIRNQPRQPRRAGLAHRLRHPRPAHRDGPGEPARGRDAHPVARRAARHAGRSWS